MRTRSGSKLPPQNPPEEVGKASGSRKLTGAKRKQDDKVSAVELKNEDEELKLKTKMKGKRKADEECSTVNLNTPPKEEEESESKLEEAINGDTTEMDWEEGDIPTLEPLKEVTVEFTDSPSDNKKPSRRASAREKELGELVHKVHLLCLLARGRLVDKACNDPLIQASMLSFLPSDLLNITEVPNLTINDLKPLVNWFHSKFHLSNEGCKKGSFESNLQIAIQNQEGTAEELAALSVVLFRALNLTTRFVSILDISNTETQRLDPKAVPSPNTKKITKTPPKLPKNKKLKTEKSPTESPSNEIPKTEGPKHKSPTESPSNEIPKTEGPKRKSDTESPSNEFPKKETPKRKSDIEFELQLQMALSATETSTSQSVNLENSQFSPSNLGNSRFSPSTSRKSAIWSKNGPNLYFAEVFCTGEMLTGRWIHVDCINGVLNCEDKVENNLSVCKKILKYVVAFNGNGAKDVTRRYCTQWYKIALKRVKEDWWERVLNPLRELELRKNGILDQNSIEDLELENRALTEPLPTNQLAYKNHNQYAIEKWLNKNQVIHPKGPVLGFCAGQPVYPRFCVQTLQTRHNWMKDGFQVKPNEIAAKFQKVSRPKKRINFEEREMEKEIEEENNGNNNNNNIELYGKWQLEPLQLPHAINGIVPKNEHGNVEVWSEKCVPPGTVHLRLPRLVPLAKLLQIDFAQALVGFEFHSGKTYPVFDGIVICSEFQHALLAAYGESEERREIEERKRDEKQALSKWFQLINSIVVRQRLKNSYAGPSNVVNTFCNEEARSEKSEVLRGVFEKETTRVVSEFENEHEHVFKLEKESFDEETNVRIKRCECGFSIQVEEL
ncbi:hypothetical protein LUZ60_003153 [Juncus effusus]|nr:hypothetical protein LUZ60_003153 [Juncus effusus]